MKQKRKISDANANAAPGQVERRRPVLFWWCGLLLSTSAILALGTQLGSRERQSPPEEAAEGHLKTLTAPQELVAFLSIRGMCLREQSRLSEAAESFAAAARLAPRCRSYRRTLGSLEAALGPQRGLARQSESLPLRLAAIAALGSAGGPSEKALLQSLPAQAGSPLQPAIATALRRLNARLGQPEDHI